MLPGKRREEHVGREVLQPEADEIKAKAVEFLTQIFKVMDEEISIDTDFNYQDNELNVMMSGDDMGVLIGKRGQTLDSLQYLVSLVVNKHRDVYIRVKLDTENYRERREQKLKSLARNIAHKVKRYLMLSIRYKGMYIHESCALLKAYQLPECDIRLWSFSR